MIGWLFEIACVATGGHYWDRSRICTDVCMNCAKIRFISGDEQKLRTLEALKPFMDEMRTTLERGLLPKSQYNSERG